MAGHSEKWLLQISYSVPRLACCGCGWVQIEACPAVPGLLQLQRGQRHQTEVLHSLVLPPVPGRSLATGSSLALHPYWFLVLPLP